MQRELLVYLDIRGEPVQVGRLWAREHAGRESSSFVYDAAWLKRKGAFALSPALMPSLSRAARSSGTEIDCLKNLFSTASLRSRT